MQCIKYHFPPSHYTAYDIRDMQNRENVYHSWKNFFYNSKKNDPSEYFILYWYIQRKKIQTGKLCVSLSNKELSLELMTTVEFSDDFCLWLPPHEDPIKLY